MSTERKARRSTTAERRTHAPGGTASLNTDFELSIARGNCGAWANNADFLVPPSFMQCPEEEALCYWFLNLVMLPRHPESICGFMEHLLPMYQHAKVDSQLSLITTAAAFSALGKVPGRESLMPMATKMYSKALTAVKSALYDPIEAKKDETLMTVLLMCLYEVSYSPLL